VVVHPQRRSGIASTYNIARFATSYSTYLDDLAEVAKVNFDIKQGSYLKANKSLLILDEHVYLSKVLDITSSLANHLRTGYRTARLKTGRIGLGSLNTG
jgi:hypothetical protein